MKRIVCILLALMVFMVSFTSFAVEEVVVNDGGTAGGGGNGSNNSDPNGSNNSNSTSTIAAPQPQGGGEDFFAAGNPNEIYAIIDNDHGPIEYIASIVNLIAVFVAIIVVAIYGIQWLTANAAQKQQLKASLAPMLVGVFLIVVGPRFAMAIIRTVISAAH